MPAPRFRSFVLSCIALAGFASILLVISACADKHPPQKPTDPGVVAQQVIGEFLSLPIAEVTLVSVAAKDFNDSSLGCPEPRMAYHQVITPGHHVIVEAEGRRFDVRVAGNHGRICRNSKRNKPGFKPNRNSATTAMIDGARRSLAALLNAKIANIRMLDIRPYEGKNPPTDCTPVCTGTDQQCGYIIGLSYADRRYNYHATDNNIVPCPPILRT